MNYSIMVASFLLAYSFAYEARPLVRYVPTWENKTLKMIVQLP